MLRILNAWVTTTCAWCYIHFLTHRLQRSSWIGCKLRCWRTEGKTEMLAKKFYCWVSNKSSYVTVLNRSKTFNLCIIEAIYFYCMKNILRHVPLIECNWFECCFYRLFINYSLSSRLLWYQLLRCLFYILLRYWLYYKMRMYSMSSHLWLHVDHKRSTNSTEDIKYHENGTNEYV